MKYLYKYLAIFPICLFLFSGCNKFLDVEPKGKQLLVTVKDYDLWLNSVNLTNETHAYTLLRMTDLYDQYPYNETSSSASALMYRWAPQFNDAASIPEVWTGFYANIYYYNAVINGIDGAIGGEQEKKSLKGEALLGRAFEYLYLVNLYGKVYDQATAAQDLAVPFVVSSDIVTKTPPRSTVQELYDHIISDINEAITGLPDDNANNRFRGAKVAAYSVLARTYFYMRDYPNARKYAEIALKTPSLSMLDYNTGVTSPTAYPLWPILVTRKDVLYARGAGARAFVATIPVTPEFAKIYVPGDMRAYLIKDPNKPTLSDDPKRGALNYCFAYSNSTNSGNANNANIGPSVAEMKLIIAEVAARDNDLNTALEQLHDVRKNRFTPASYIRFQSADDKVVLQKVLDERILELPFAGLRWLDMRRLDAEGRMPEVYRYGNNGEVVATLKQKDPRYVLQIPNNVLSYNPDMPQNP